MACCFGKVNSANVPISSNLVGSQYLAKVAPLGYTVNLYNDIVPVGQQRQGNQAYFPFPNSTRININERPVLIPYAYFSKVIQ